jgi:hypothetical protein
MEASTFKHVDLIAQLDFPAHPMIIVVFSTLKAEM